MGLLHDLDDGRKREITEEDFDYFLDVLPPVAMGFRWNGERWAFGFAEGANFVYAFKKENGRYYAQKTNLMNPRECGVSLEEQQHGITGRLGDERGAPPGGRADRTR